MRAAVAVMAAAAAFAAPKTVLLPGQSPLVSLRFVFRTGAADDPAGKFGLAALTASMLGEAGSRKLTYQQIVDRLFPMAASISVQTDKEMTTFSAVTHVENLEAFYELFRDMLLDPGWRNQDFTRLRDDQINALRVGIRGNNDEELGKEVLYNLLYRDHPYGHHNLGTAGNLQSIKMADLQAFYKAHYTQANLIVGLAGGYPPAFLQRVLQDFGKLPAGKASGDKPPAPKKVEGLHLTIIDKPTRSVAISFGHPIEVRRGHPDFLPLLVAQSYLGQHRNSSGRMYNRIREARGLNYGDYAYIEYFPNGMFRFEPAPNLARPQQIFQVWIRPLEVPTAHFGFRLALWELERLIEKGLTPEQFESTRSFVSKYVNLLTKDKSSELGYAIDSAYYGIPDYNRYVKEGLAKLTVADVNRAIQRHLRSTDMQIVMVAAKGEEWKQRLVANEPSPMNYNSGKPADVLEEDKVVEKKGIPLTADRVVVVPVDKVFE